MQNIYLIRHGQSQGNIDQAIYRETPDHAIGLSDLGVEQARAAGQALRNQLHSVTQLRLDKADKPDGSSLKLEFRTVVNQQGYIVFRVQDF